MTDSQLLISRIEDAILSSEYGEPSFLGFLNEVEAAEACGYLKNRRVNFTLSGGFPQASRVYLCICDSTDSVRFPITALSIKSTGSKPLTHRDFLGSLMGLGIKRECIGDILLSSDNQAVVFVREDMAPHIIRDLDKVSRDRVKVSYYSEDIESLCNRTEDSRIIVSSMRIDNLVSSLVGCSRSVASELIKNDKIFCNYLLVKKPSLVIVKDDIISIRGYGKYIIGDFAGKSRRDNIILNISRYV